MTQTNTTQGIEKEICPVWEEQSKISFNTYDARTDATGSQDLFGFISKLEKELEGTEGKVVINGGHFIPNIGNPDAVNGNPRETWNMACYTAKRLQARGIDARVSVIINDLPISAEDRQKMPYSIPEAFLKVAHNYGVSIMNDSSDKERAYSEKRCANSFGRDETRAKYASIYPEKIKNYCVSAIIDYLRDIQKQGATKSIWITPKCSWKNMIEALKLYTKHEGGVQNECYFETPNCFK